MTSLRLHALVWWAEGAHYGLDLTVASEQTVVVVAEPSVASGLADVVLGLAVPVGGSVRTDGKDVTRAPLGRRRVAVVPPGGGLLPHLTVEGNVAYAAGRERAAMWLRELQLEGIGRMRPHELSPVQRLQVAVGRALGTDPVVVLIEDREGQAPCRTAVNTVLRHGAGVLVISDSVRRAARLGTAVHPREVTAGAT